MIHRGDLLHCDFGIRYLGLCTDTQQMAYLLKDGVPGLGDFPLHEDTAHSIELIVRSVVQEWGNTDVRIPLEQDSLFRRAGPSWMDQWQTAIIRIR